ncbi:hypothetical protein [Desulforhopalus singaporensis]|uniref:Uncharacterized protein n=1 Tax=Desulforhopalus singaporensis TaxID=91360 RepID=A0A1H0VJ44_9BACT|nr:hypothetical protein [Desulforhopalus singaporensis]SDP78086.1 hypothetical protein SAMN05660330_04084 [Desulforhopalus singaporensis]
MSLATIADARALGSLPASEKLDDTVIQPHLDSAARELKSWIGVYESTSDSEKKESCIEAECCICMAYLQPILQKLYEQGAVDSDQPASDTWRKTADSWTERARSRVRSYEEDNTSRNKVGWHAI